VINETNVDPFGVVDDGEMFKKLKENYLKTAKLKPEEALELQTLALENMNATNPSIRPKIKFFSRDLPASVRKKFLSPDLSFERK